MKALKLFAILLVIFWSLPAFAQFPTTFLMKLAEQGDALSQYMLGVAYALGEKVPQDDDKAAYWMEKAAKQDVAEAQLLLGTYYANYAKGEGVPKDYSKATYWLKKAADNGSDGGKALLGIFYLEGRGVIRDKQMGCKLLREAAQNEGDSKAMAMDAFSHYCAR